MIDDESTVDKVQYLTISNMSCASCVATIENSLKQVPGVDDARVNFAERSAEIHGIAKIETLVNAVAKAGYSAIQTEAFT